MTEQQASPRPTLSLRQRLAYTIGVAGSLRGRLTRGVLGVGSLMVAGNILALLPRPTGDAGNPGRKGAGASLAAD